MIMNKITALLSILFISSLFCSCEHPGIEYIVQEKGLNVQESTIYVDGFLAKGTPAFAGDENEPGDRLGIPFVNGFGRKLLVKFVDRSSETGLKIEDGEVQLSFQGDKQYAYFPISGTPTQDGSVPISFDIFEDGEKIGTTVTKTIPIWAEGTQRPARELIPTSEKPFVLLGGEINWVNQSAPVTGAQNEQIFWYARMSSPSTEIKTAGLTYNCVANLRYNSIMIANNAIRPSFTEENGVKALTLFIPTQENIEQYPEAFTLKDGALSHVWGENDIFFHGTNSKPISVGMWDETHLIYSMGETAHAPCHLHLGLSVLQRPSLISKSLVTIRYISNIQIQMPVMTSCSIFPNILSQEKQDGCLLNLQLLKIRYPDLLSIQTLLLILTYRPSMKIGNLQKVIP